MKSKSIDQIVKERADDTLELQKRAATETVSQKIDRFLSGKMNAAQADCFTREHGLAIDAEIERREQAAERSAERAKARIVALWEGRDIATADENAADRNVIEQFCKDHPNFRRDIPENGRFLLTELRLNQESITAENLEKAYANLQKTGVFQTRTADEKEIATMSADQFKAVRPELRNQGIPPLILQSISRTLSTFAATHPEYVLCPENERAMTEAVVTSGLPITVQLLESTFQNLASAGLLKLNAGAVASSGQSTFTDYGDIRHGGPPRPNKPSFRKRIESMSSAEIAEACRLDPAFERALNNL
jgi:hypothetical protein